MAFCTNCGKEFAADTKFCPACGTEHTITANGNAIRKQEYVGIVPKCPACGEEIPALTAICPACGHEINSVKISPTLLAFSEKIEQYDKEIANNIEPTTGWKTWSKTARILWIIANILTLGLLAVAILGVKYIVSFSKHPKLSPTEKKKTALIENLSIPNEREATLEVLLFIKAKISFLSSGKKDSHTAYWLRIWGTKATQIFDKAKILIGEDIIAAQSYSYIQQQIERNQKNAKIKTIMASAILLVYLSIVIVIHPIGSALVERSGIELPKLPEPPEYIGTVVEAHEIRDYCGMNLAACGKYSTFYGEYQDTYGNGYVKLSVITEDSIYIAPDDIDTMEQYIVVQQSIKPETTITFQFAKERDGDYGKTTQMYRSFDEIVLYVQKRTGSTSGFYENAALVPINESPDEYTYYIRDYTGRNLASCGTYYNYSGVFRDDYGAGVIVLNIISDDATYFHLDRIEQLREYVIIGQGTAPNTEVKFTFDEYIPSLWSFTGSSIQIIDVYVKRLDEQTILNAYQSIYDSKTYIENSAKDVE